MKYFLMLLSFIFLTGCAPKVVDLSTINPSIKPIAGESIAVYDESMDAILFYDFFQKETFLMQKTSGKVIPFRVEFMDLWITGLGHDIQRLTQGNAEEIRPALLYNAKQKGLKTLHVNQKDYIIETTFAHDMVDAIDRYEEKMRRYERDKRFPLLMKH
ncbi:hypothetical protein [Sulfurospirillum barnesii]|uniref:Uncharacterized protein n=1 Tax=Sulfurospirillum barnesii (strain ATCC 700032 / DSM 10660 / SES-3) TaxID=760154 RepID=I3XY51_SULBS|nr:hypothetical protein [Sulfurospirillum barnesii]AFL68875.1 hypothetical protein Sulba_1587 [Sulfurospirillum barnesii SES-3]